jgi:thiol-disulfide isomerase/thioredoxin
MKINKNSRMSMILFYSNYCDKCKEILPILSQCQAKKDINFINIDNRIKKNDGATYIILENQKEIILPPNVSKVPALLLINRGSQVIFGKQIIEHIQPRQMQTIQSEKNVPNEPMSFSLGDINSYGVMSDNFSFLDQSVDSLAAKGNGGLRQLRNYFTLDGIDNIETPPDDYEPNKINSSSLEKAQMERDSLAMPQ